MKPIKLSQGKVAWVDDEDYERVNAFKWCASNNKRGFYAKTNIIINGKRTMMFMHRFIMNGRDYSIKVDHIDGDGLNNQRSNLRFCTNQQNCRNNRSTIIKTSRHNGVCFNKKSKKFMSGITVDGKNIHLGYFTIEDDAGLAYNKAASEYFKEFACLNII